MEMMEGREGFKEKSETEEKTGGGARSPRE